MTEQNNYIYALCRTYDPTPVRFKDERKITLGLDSKPLVVESFFLFKTKRDEYAARLEIVGRDNGIVIGLITDHVEQRPVSRQIPLDDLVEDSEIARPVR
jgi:hypothetical protein